MDIQFVEEHYRKNKKTYVKIIASRLGSLPRDLAEDIVQETYAKCIANLHTFTGNAFEFEKWIRKCMNNSFRDLQRDERDKGTVKTLEDEEFPEEVIEEVSYQDFTHIVPAKYLDMFNMYTFGGHLAKDIAEAEGVSYSYVRKALSICVKTIRDDMDIDDVILKKFNL